NQRTHLVPSFEGLKPASEAASRAKRANRKHNTQPELILRKALWLAGLRYRTHVPGLPGNPDIVFTRARVVVFCDADFWHGRRWVTLRSQLKRRHNADYWIPKIARNRKRDKQQTARLAKDGWVVIRVWETDVIRAPEIAAQLIKETIQARPRQLL